MESRMEIDEDNQPPLQRKVSSYTCNILSKLRDCGQLCDAVIKVEGEEFPIHRAILSASSPYFLALFTNDMFCSEKRVVTLPEVSPDIMRLIIDYAYTRKADITVDNVEQLLPAADQFHVNGLVKICCDFLISKLSPDNCIGIHRFAEAYFCHNLAKIAHRYIMYNFGDVLQESTEFLQLDIEKISELLGSDDLNVKNEEFVFCAALKWIDYDPRNRKTQMARLLRSVRLGLLTSQYVVEKVKSHPYVKECPLCKPVVIETIKFLYDLDMDEDKDVDLTNPLAKPRVPHEVLFVVGGWSGGSPTNIVETYDTRADRWIVSEYVDSGPRAYHGTIALENNIFIVGGFDGVEYFNSVRKFNPVSKTWTEAAPMNAKRCYVSVAEMDGMIYAMGGFDGHVRQSTAERYQPKKNQWSLVSPMRHQRSDASATSLEGKIYICGGFNGQECLCSAEYYDPATNQWTLLPDMRNRRSGIGVIGYHGCVYALGGFNGITRMNTGEMFNVSTNQWRSVPEMYNPRSNFAVEVIDDMIFVIGGFNGVTTIYNVECFDNTTEEWYDATDMNLYRSALSACVVKKLPNIQDFIYKGPKPSEKKNKGKSQQPDPVQNAESQV